MNPVNDKSAAAWRAIWTIAAVVLASGLTQILLDQSLMVDFFSGRNDQLFWRTIAVAFAAGALNGLKKYYNLKLPAPGPAEET